MVWELEQLSEFEDQVLIDGSWVVARPLNNKYRSLLQKIKESFWLFRGDIEAFRWPENQ